MPKSLPPHLPKPMSNLKNHQLSERLKLLFVVSVVSLLAGLSGASIMFGWLLPEGYGNNIFISSKNKSTENSTIDESARKELTDKIYFIYSQATKINGLQYLDNNNFLGEAIAISSDGWLVVYVGQNLSTNNIVAVNHKNNLEKISQKVYDQYTGLLFIKIDSANQLKLVNFQNNIIEDEPLFVYRDKKWQSNYIDKKVSADPSGHLDIEPAWHYVLKNNQQKNLVAFDQRGNALGFLTSANTLLNIKYLNRIMPQFLSNKSISYNSLGIEGFYAGEKPIVTDKPITEAFAVSRLSNTAQTKLKAGDIIIEIDGVVVSEDNLWYNINNKKSVNIVLLRNGKKLHTEGITVLNL